MSAAQLAKTGARATAASSEAVLKASASKIAQQAAKASIKQGIESGQYTTKRLGRLKQMFGGVDEVTQAGMNAAARKSNELMDAKIVKHLDEGKTLDENTIKKFANESAAEVAEAAEQAAKQKSDEIAEAAAKKSEAAAKKSDNTAKAAGNAPKKTKWEQAKTGAKYAAGATLAGTAAYSGIDAAASGKNFNETFEKNLSTVAGGIGSAAKTTVIAGTSVAKPVVSGVAGGLSEGLGINNMFSGINSSMLMMIAAIFILYMKCQVIRNNLLNKNLIFYISELI